MIEIRWDWIADHLDDVAEKTWQHLQLLVIPMVAGFIIAFALAVLALRRPGTVGPVTAVTGLLYTIPSLAAFAVLIPITGLSLMTAIIPLTTYTLLILYVNTVAGLRSVPPEVNEAADAMGYTRSARLLRVQLPLAIPLIFAGIRVAAVTGPTVPGRRMARTASAKAMMKPASMGMTSSWRCCQVFSATSSRWLAIQSQRISTMV